MEVTITLDADVVERLMEEPLTEECGYGETRPLSLDEFVNREIRNTPRPSVLNESAREWFVMTGARLGLPGYTELWEEER